MYYKLTDAIKNVGVYPQVTGMNPEFDWQAFEKANREFNPLLNNSVPAPITLPMRPGAKVTDALSVVNPSWPFLAVNERLLHFLQSVQADPLRVMPTTAVKKGVPYPYLLVAIDTRRPEYVDYQKSSFTIRDMEDIDSVPEEILIVNAQEYNSLLRQYGYSKYIQATKLVLKENVIQHDIFRLPHYATSRYLVSEKFREGIEREKITGLRFDPIESAV